MKSVQTDEKCANGLIWAQDLTEKVLGSACTGYSALPEDQEVGRESL